MSYGKQYEDMQKDFNVGDVVLYDEGSGKDFLVFEVGEVFQIKWLFPVPGSVLSLNRGSMEYMGTFEFKAPVMAMEKFSIQHCRKLIDLNKIREDVWYGWDDDVREYIRSTYANARYDEQALYCYLHAENGV